MAIANTDQMNSAQDQYKTSFDEDVVAPVRQSDDEAFGLTLPAEAVAAAESDGPGVAAVDAAAAPELEAAPVKVDGDIDQNAGAPEMPMDPKELQRIKSHEGRMKKMEAEANSKAAPADPVDEPAEVLEAVAEKAQDQGDTELSDAVDQVAAQVEDGSMSVAQAKQQLVEDFGDSFIKLIEIVAGAAAADAGIKAVDGLKGDVSNIIDHISSSAKRMHFKEIAGAHPDFRDVGSSEEFQAYLADQDGRKQVADNGSAEDVIKLISDYKSSRQSGPVEPEADATGAEAPGEVAQDDPEGADAAAGVRSGGLRLPAQPADNNDFEGAWNEAAKGK